MFVREAPAYGIAALFAKGAAIQRTRRNSANTPQFGEHAAIRRTRRNSANTPHFHGKRCCNPAKGASIQVLRRFTRWHTVARPSKCGGFGGRKAAHMPACFQVPLRRVCCILFDAYRRDIHLCFYFVELLSFSFLFLFLTLFSAVFYIRTCM